MNQKLKLLYHEIWVKISTLKKPPPTRSLPSNSHVSAITTRPHLQIGRSFHSMVVGVCD
jgi:hypothetical protein